MEVEAWGCPFFPSLRRFSAARGDCEIPPWSEGPAIKQPWPSSGWAVRMRLLPEVLALLLLLLLSSSVPGGGECFGCLSIRVPPKHLDSGTGCPRWG